MRNFSIYKKCITIRKFEEYLLKVFDKGVLRGTTHTCIGQELLPVLVAEFRVDGDVVIGNHRSHGHYLSISGNYNGLLAEIIGDSSGINRGHGGSQHIFDENIVIEFIGDGTFGEGIVYEAMNLASLVKAPLLLVLEDNGIAQTTDTKLTTSGTIEGRARAFGFDYIFADSIDPRNLEKAVEAAISRVRIARLPLLLHVRSYRLGPHSKGDDTRSEHDLESLWRRDPISFLEKELTVTEIEIANSEAREILNNVIRKLQLPLL